MSRYTVHVEHRGEVGEGEGEGEGRGKNRQIRPKGWRERKGVLVKDKWEGSVQ